MFGKECIKEMVLLDGLYCIKTVFSHILHYFKYRKAFLLLVKTDSLQNSPKCSCSPYTSTAVNPNHMIIPDFLHANINYQQKSIQFMRERCFQIGPACPL